MLFTRGGVQGCGAGPGREPVAVDEPGGVTDIGQDAGSDHGPTPHRSIRCDTRARTIGLSSALALFILGAEPVVNRRATACC